MKKNRRVFSSEFKSKVVLESLKERETLASLAKKFEIHPQQITDWKQRFLSGLRDFFWRREEYGEIGIGARAVGFGFVREDRSFRG